MNLIPICGKMYQPPIPDVLPVECTFLKDHPADRCSWWVLKESYDAQTQAPQEIQVFLDAINEGRADEYLEAILAAAHGRKRQRRGVRVPYGVRSA